MEQRVKYLFEKYLNNTCTSEEFEELFGYLETGEHEAGLEETIQQAYKAGRVSPVRTKPKRSFALPIAATILILTIAGISWLTTRKQLNPVSGPLPHEKLVKRITGRSEYKYLLLPDSTQVWLNAESSIEFPDKFDGRSRKVVLKGEAYFDVKHADKTPFVIYTGDVSTEVLGTAFNIKAYPGLEKITVSVKRGKVKVNYANKQVATLTTGQEVSIGSKTRAIKEKIIDENQSVAWHEGKLVYDDYAVSDILSDLQRIYDIRINLAVPELTSMRVSTSFKREQGAENALEIICKLTDTRIKIENGVYHIISQK